MPSARRSASMPPARASTRSSPSRACARWSAPARPEMNPLVNPGRDLLHRAGPGRAADEVWTKIIGIHNDFAGRQLDGAAGRLQVGVRHQPAQPGHRRADAGLRLHQGQLAAGRRPLHAAVLDWRQRQGPGDDGRNAGVRRQEPGHQQAGDGRGEGARCTRGDGDGRTLRRLAASGCSPPGCRRRAASAAGSSPCRLASSASRWFRRRSTTPATASGRSARSPTSRTRSAAIRTRQARRSRTANRRSDPGREASCQGRAVLQP